MCTISLIFTTMMLHGVTHNTSAQGIESPAKINTVQIAQRSLSLDCFEYQVIGLCYFLDCTPLGCSVKVSPRISHYLPDAVVCSYQRSGDNPWIEMSPVSNAAHGIVGPVVQTLFNGVLPSALEPDGGHQREGVNRRYHENVRFKETDVIGHPLASLSALISDASALGAGEGGNALALPEFLSDSQALKTFLDAQDNTRQLREWLQSVNIVDEIPGLEQYLGLIAAFTGTTEIAEGLQGVQKLQQQVEALNEVQEVLSGVEDLMGVLNTLTGSESGGFLCRSEAISFLPYFLSMADSITWRAGIPFSPEVIYWDTILLHSREIGHWPLNTWGAVHPRDGFVNHPEDPKVAAVTAQRAADVVTRKNQPHVYLPMPLTHQSCGAGCEPPGPVFENNPENSKWQMLSPVPSSECEVFGQNDLTWLNSWAVGKQGASTGEDYVWNLWRRYRCCLPASGLYLGATAF